VDWVNLGQGSIEVANSYKRKNKCEISCPVGPLSGLQVH
jgi:hypothetical protein